MKSVSWQVTERVQQVLELIEEQSKRLEQRIDALLLVGGFAGSEYLFKKVEVRHLVETLIGPNCPLIWWM